MRRFTLLGLIIISVSVFLLILMGAGTSVAHPKATINVNSTADSGPGTLRQALLDAVNGDTITFDPTIFPPNNPATITLTSGQLPTIFQGNLLIDASDVGVIIDGSNLTDPFDDIFDVNSDANTIRGLQITNAPENGITIADAKNNVIGGNRGMGLGPSGQGNVIGGNGGHGILLWGDSSNNTIVGNYIGTMVDGTSASPNLRGGIIFHSGTTSNTVGGPLSEHRNIITYNSSHGINIQGTNANNNLIQNNWIGIDADSTGGLDPRDLVVADDGTVFLANYGQGIFKSTDNAASWQTINSGLSTLNIEILAVAPDFATSQRLWAWGEGLIFVSDDAGINWSLLNNTLPGIVKDVIAAPNYGTSPLLLATVEEASDSSAGGIYRSVDGGSTWVQVYSIWYVSHLAFSPNFAVDGLVLVNAGNGVARSTDGGITWSDSSNGLPASNTRDLAFTPDGNSVFLASHNCGSDEGVYRSNDGGQTWIASGTGLNDCGPDWGIAISPDFVNDNTLLVAEDSIYRSQDAGASWQWANEGAFGSRGVTLAFSPDFAISQLAYRVSFAGVFRTANGGATWIWAGANLANRGNGGNGVQISSDAGPNQIIGNVISANANQGIEINSDQASGSLIEANILGLGPNGVIRAGNGGTNIWLGAPYITVTNNTSAAGSHGGLRSGSVAHHLSILNNRFGTDVNGNMAMGNSYDGMTLDSSYDTVHGNIVSGNWGAGIWVSENFTDTTSSVFTGNIIGLDTSGSNALPNHVYGIGINGSEHTIGGPSESDRNIISGNKSAGVALFGPYAENNIIIGNYIGTDITGAIAIGNGHDGISVFNDANNNIIGGDTPEERNIISGNQYYGIQIHSNAHQNTVSGNYIGLDATGTYTMANPRVLTGHVTAGLMFQSNANDNIVGGSMADERNLISSGGWFGITLSDSHGNQISGNDIGTNAAGDSLTGSNLVGIYLDRGSTGNIIGGDTGWQSGICDGECNVITGNSSHGIRVYDSTTIRNSIIQNSIYANGGLGIDLLNGGNTELSAPTITTFNMAAGTASGTACANCTIEVYSDAAGEGRWFEGSITANAGGAWSFSKGSPFTGVELTATATDSAGNTSEFGQDWPASPPPAPFIAAPVCGLTNQSQPLFNGIAQMGSTVRLGAGGLNLGSTTTNDQNQWSLPTGTSLPNGSHVITATAETTWGTSPISSLALSVDNSLCYDPVGITFNQGNSVQHLRDSSGCADPGNALEVTLWPNMPVTVSVPITPSGPISVTVNNVDYPLSDAGNGRYEATFTPPTGNLVILLQLGCEIVQIGAVIDPDGFVYDADDGVSSTLADVTVTLYMSDTVRQRWVVWPANLYSQQNPQITDDSGYYSFFVPPGDYQIRAKKADYEFFVSDTITVVDDLIRLNIPLQIGREKVYLPMIVKSSD